MRKTLTAAAALFTFGVISINAAQADDPCAGHGVACDTGGCVVCWPNDNDGIDCTEASLIEVNATLPGCVPPLPSTGVIDEFAIPESLRRPDLLDAGGRTVVPQLPEPPQRMPTTPSQ